MRALPAMPPSRLLLRPAASSQDLPRVWRPEEWMKKGSIVPATCLGDERRALAVLLVQAFVQQLRSLLERRMPAAPTTAMHLRSASAPNAAAAQQEQQTLLRWMADQTAAQGDDSSDDEEGQQPDEAGSDSEEAPVRGRCSGKSPQRLVLMGAVLHTYEQQLPQAQADATAGAARQQGAAMPMRELLEATCSVAGGPIGGCSPAQSCSESLHSSPGNGGGHSVVSSSVRMP